MTKVEIQISRQTLIKIEAIRKLTGAGMAEIETVATAAVEEKISELLADVAMLNDAGGEQPEVPEHAAPETEPGDKGGYDSHAYEGIGEEGSDEYDDEEEDPIPTEQYERQQKRMPRNELGITDDDLEHDDDVEDPEHESVQQAPGVRGLAQNSEGLFAALSGMATEEDPRAVRRKAKTLKGRARVSGYGG